MFLLTFHDAACEFVNFFQVFLILDGLRLSGGDDFIEEGRHFLVVGWIVQMLLDDLASDVVFDRLGDCLFVSFDPREFLGDGLADAGFDNDLQ